MSLRFDWDEINGNIITEILGLNATTMDDGSARWDSVAICTGESACVITVEPDTDQAIISYEPSPYGDGWKHIPSFEFAKNKSVAWCWIGINSQGYKDSFTIAFGDVGPDAIWPRCTFVAAASSLLCFDLMRRRA